MGGGATHSNSHLHLRRVVVWAIVFGFIIMFGTLLFTITEPQAIEVQQENENDEKPCRAAQFDPFSDVIQLHEDNFDKLVLQDRESVWLIEFYSPLCPHCIAMKPEWEKTATLIKEEDTEILKVGKVDGTCERKLLEQYQVTGFPSIFLFENGEESKYQQPKRTALAFIAWAKDASALLSNQKRFEE